MTDAVAQGSMPVPSGTSGLLSGLRVLEIGHFVAAPFCTRLLADLGADVIKIEPPRTGDPVRQWGEQVNGHSAWWSVHGRNKRSVTLDLRSPRSREIVLGLVRQCDALVENFRPGHLARFGLDAAALRRAWPDLIVAHISGYGQDGPYRDRAAFGVIGEAVGGLRYLSNHEPDTSDLPPVRVGLSIGDSVAGLYSAFGLMAALWHRQRQPAGTGGCSLDVALTESVFSLMEGVLPEYGLLGKIRQPSGGRIATAAPTNAYRTADGVWLLIAANSDALFARLAALMGEADLPSDPRFASNPTRVAHAAELDAIIGRWTARQTAAALEEALAKADVPSTRVYTIADCATDPQFRARGMVREVDDPALGHVLHPGIVPHVPENPGIVRWPGSPVGAHTREVFHELLGLDDAQIADLAREGIC